MLQNKKQKENEEEKKKNPKRKKSMLQFWGMKAIFKLQKNEFLVYADHKLTAKAQM